MNNVLFFFLKIMFIQVLLKLYAKCQPSTLLCLGLVKKFVVVVVLRPIIVLSLAKAEQLRSTILLQNESLNPFDFSITLKMSHIILKLH